jgi:succinate-semialdehyde dehydrogenase/glutarate-semialdehyde dehydrogenase
LLLGKASTITPLLMDANEVRKISLTGSTRVGQMLMADAARTVKRFSMELGGHAPVVVCADADIEAAAVQCAAFKFRNAGQVCIAPSRFYVEDSAMDRFLDRLKAEAEALKLGDSQDKSTTMGPLTLASGREKIELLTADAISRGGRLASGGKRPDDPGLQNGYFYLPTVLDDCVPGMSVVRGLFPGGQGVAALRATDAWLAEHATAPPALRRLVLESRDDLARAVRCREHDRAEG